MQNNSFGSVVLGVVGRGLIFFRIRRDEIVVQMQIVPFHKKGRNTSSALKNYFSGKILVRVKSESAGLNHR